MRISNVGYKLVRVHDKDLKSLFQEYSTAYYDVGMITERPENAGPLCVFDSVDNAIGFMKRDDYMDIRLYECRYKKSRAKTVWDRNRIKLTYDRMPKGTVLCEKVMLVKLIKSWDRREQ